MPTLSARRLSAPCTRPGCDASRGQLCRKQMVDNLTRFLTKALKAN